MMELDGSAFEELFPEAVQFNRKKYDPYVRSRDVSRHPHQRFCPRCGQGHSPSMHRSHATSSNPHPFCSMWSGLKSDKRRSKYC